MDDEYLVRETADRLRSFIRELGDVNWRCPVELSRDARLLLRGSLSDEIALSNTAGEFSA